jgi:hypothetical protein
MASVLWTSIGCRGQPYLGFKLLQTSYEPSSLGTASSYTYPDLVVSPALSKFTNIEIMLFVHIVMSIANNMKHLEVACAVYHYVCD